MAENASTGSANSNSEFELLKPIEEEEEEEHHRDRKKKSKKSKHKDIEGKSLTTDNVNRLLYDETPSDDEKIIEIVKPPPFSKVWTDQDEISILKGMIKFKDETGRDARENMVEFHAFVLESLIRQATLVQLREKIRRLREKYEKSVERGNGSTTLHEVELFQLCDKIWTVATPEQPNSPGTGQPEQHDLLVNGKEEKQKNIPDKGQPEKQKIPAIGRLKQQSIPEIEQHKIIPETGLNVQTLEALFKRVAKDIELVLNSKACLRGNKKEVGIRVLDLSLESMGLGIKLGKLVQEKANSPELRGSPERLEQEVLRAYLEAKIEHAQLLLNAYNSFIKDHSDEAQPSVSAIDD